MGANQTTDKADAAIRVEVNNTLTSGITKADYSRPISEILSFSVENGEAVLYLRVNTLSKATASDAALGFGEKVFSYPSGLGLVQPLYTSVKLTSLCPTGLSATAGEVGLGTAVATGAIATLGAGSATMENIMEGTTLSNHVAATTLVSEKANLPVAFGDHGAAGAFGLLDASSSAVAAYLNIASTFNQTAAESITFSATIVHRFRVLSSDFGVL
jgi:hypothetical protein